MEWSMFAPADSKHDTSNTRDIGSTRDMGGTRIALCDSLKHG